MNEQITQRRDSLRTQYQAVAGRPFEHFFCPMLYVDEPAELCRAHVVNQAFTDSSSAWTIQRKDVDNFYGSMFEATFLNIRFREPGIAMKAMLDRDLYRRLRPRVLLDGEEIPHFIPKGPIPDRFARLEIEDGQRHVTIGLKIPIGVEVSEDSRFEFIVEHDFRIHALVSVLKAAHLTAFQLLEYTYALGPGGTWLGQRLGQFYRRNRSKSPKEVRLAALEHFRECAAMVRPVAAAPPAISGTVDDRWLHFCWTEDGGTRPWGLLVYTRTETQLHVAVVPAFEDDSGAKRFDQFLSSTGDSFEVSIARFENTYWNVESDRRRVHWPPAELE